MERWREIPGYEGLYEASDLGNIRTVAGKVTENARGKRVWKQRVLKQKWAKRKGHSGKSDARVSLWKDCKERSWLVSRLVAMAWCAGDSNDATVNHIDGNPSNNHADNLEWVTLRRNIQIGFRDGLFPQQRATNLTDKAGKVLHFTSMAEASRFLGKHHGYVSAELQKGHNVLDGYRVEII